MEIFSVQNLCHYLISCAIQRCRLLDDLCRLSVVLKSSPFSNLPLVQISISDTGVGSGIEEFLDLKNMMRDPTLANKWGLCDSEIYHYNLDLKETASARRMIKLPSNAKNGARFSGTEVSLTSCESIDDILADITYLLRKMLVLKITNIGIEMVVHQGTSTGSRNETIISANKYFQFPSPASNIECLKSGLEDYVLKHGNSVDGICGSCFSSKECLKVGGGLANSAERRRTKGQVMEAVIIVSKAPEPSSPSCFRGCDLKTEVLYFKDFSPCSISQSSLNALTSIDWQSYGLSLKRVAQQDGCAVLEWDNKPLYFHVDVALHCYHKQIMIPPMKDKVELDQTLTKKAVKLALNDLKEKNAGILLSAHALKIRTYAPDLARTVAGLILCSDDKGFQGECLSLLGLQHQESKREIVEKCIKEKIVSVIELNDRKPERSREAVPYLFEDDSIQEADFVEEEYDEGEEACSSLDL